MWRSWTGRPRREQRRRQRTSRPPHEPRWPMHRGILHSACSWAPASEKLRATNRQHRKRLHNTFNSKTHTKSPLSHPTVHLFPLASPPSPLFPRPKDSPPTCLLTPRLCPVTCCPPDVAERPRTGPRHKALRTTLRCTPRAHLKATSWNSGWRAALFTAARFVPRLFSTRTRPCCPRCHPTFNDPRLPDSSNDPCHFRQRHPCLDRPLVPPETGSPEQNSKRSSNDMPRLCESWMEGARGALWQKPRAPPKRKREHDNSPPDPHDNVDDFQERDERATALARGQLSEACSGLLDELPASYSESVGKEMREHGPPPRAEDVARLEVLSVGPVATTPSISLIQDELLSFAPNSSAAPTANTSRQPTSRLP